MGEGWQRQFTEKVIAKHQARVSTGRARAQLLCGGKPREGEDRSGAHSSGRTGEETLKIQLCTLYHLLERLPASIQVQ